MEGGRPGQLGRGSTRNSGDRPAGALCEFLTHRLQRDHQRQRLSTGRLEPEPGIERRRILIESVNHNRAHRNGAGGAVSTTQRIEKKASPQTGSLLGPIDGQAGNQADRNREVLGGSASNITRRLVAIDLRGNERVVADHRGLPGKTDDEGPSRVTTLALSGVGAQPTVELLAAAVEAIDLMARSERFDRPEARAQPSRTLGRSVSAPRPASKEAGSSSAARKRPASSALRTMLVLSASTCSASRRAAWRTNSLSV